MFGLCVGRKRKRKICDMFAYRFVHICSIYIAVYIAVYISVDFYLHISYSICHEHFTFHSFNSIFGFACAIFGAAANFVAYFSAHFLIFFSFAFSLICLLRFRS